MPAFTCPHCGGPIAYNPASDAMNCPYCDSIISVEDYREFLAPHGRLLLNELSCPQCGAQLLTTDVTTATFCSYCGSSVALESRLVEEDRPDKIIPFKVSKKRAEKIYREKIHQTLLAPDWMEDPENTSHFRGIYMPFHVFRYGWKGAWEGEASETSVRRIKGVDYDVTRTYDTGAQVEVNYDYIPQDASTAFPDAMSRAVCPYNRKNERDFELPYYAGYYADRGDVDASLYTDKFAALVKEDVEAKGTLHCGKVNVSASKATKDMQLEPSTKRAMFPVWFLSMRNRDRVNYACVNGDTGELVCDIPIDFKKYLKASLIVAGLFSILLNLFLTLKPNNLLVFTSILALVAFIIANSLLNDTYRRVKRWDDPGYSGVDVDRVVEKKRFGIFMEALGKIIATSVGLFAALMIMVFFNLDEDFLVMVTVFSMFFWVSYVIYAFVRAIRNGSGGTRMARKKAPAWYKAVVLVKPVLAMVAAVAIISFFPSVDEYCYAAAIFGIVMICWTAFDVVRTQNRFTMRDLPLFNEKRGGEA